MFRKISLFLVLVLVIGALSACAGSEAGTTELTDEKKEEIEHAWLALKGYTWSWADGPSDRGGRYYGNYNGYEMLYCDPPGGVGGAAIMYEYKIAGEKFICGGRFNLFAYRNGKFYDLEELFKKGRVSRKSIAAMAETHKTWFPHYYED